MKLLSQKLRNLVIAMEKEEGIRPFGTVQAELRSLLSELVDHVQTLEEKVAGLDKRVTPPPLTRLEEKIDRLLSREEKPLFDRIFGRP